MKPAYSKAHQSTLRSNSIKWRHSCNETVTWSGKSIGHWIIRPYYNWW